MHYLKKEGKVPNTPAPEEPIQEKEREPESESNHPSNEKKEEATEMTPDEKRALSADINLLEEDQVGELVQIIRSRMPIPNNSTNPDEIEIDLEQLDNSTLRYLETYVKKCINNQKSKAMEP